MNISITGNLGSGKSSICRYLKEKGYEIISAGTIFRELAIEHNMSVEDFNQKVNEDIKKGDRSVDQMIDKRTAEINKWREGVIFDSRLAWNFAPDSFKVFVIVDINEAARRVYHDAVRSDSESYESVEVCRTALVHRQQLEKQRFQELYQIDYFDMGNYNLVIESTHVSPEVVAEEIIARFAAYQRGAFRRLVELNLKSLFPTKEISDIIYIQTKTEAACEPEAEIGQAGGLWFILKGHGQYLNAVKEGRHFLNVQVKTDFQPRILPPPAYGEYETAGGYLYHKYPGKEQLDHPNLLVFP